MIRRNEATISSTISNLSTLFYPGIFCSELHASRYCKGKSIELASGEYAYCEDYHNLSPLNVLINPYFKSQVKNKHVDPYFKGQIQDMHFNPFNNIISYFNFLILATSLLTAFVNWYQGIKIYKENKKTDALNFSYALYAVYLSQISVGQETDIESHYQKYLAWKEDNPNADALILWGLSRGAATTFNAYSKYHYPEVKLVVLEGCFNTLNDVFSPLPPVSLALNACISLFTQYKKDGPTPAKSVDNFPEGVPVVFITSEKDFVVPSQSTEKLAHALNKREKNDVYLLKLKHSSHIEYIFSNETDRNNYEYLIHAVYKKYNLRPFIEEYARKGQQLLKDCLLESATKNYTETKYENMLPNVKR